MTTSSAHLFTAGGERFVYRVADGCIYPVPDVFADAIDGALNAGDDDRAHLLLAAAGLPAIDAPSIEEEPSKIRALSLAISQSCNLACTYCYAEGGSFGTVGAKPMREDQARRAAELLIAEAQPGETVSLTFLGGEPLLGRRAMRAVTEYAVALAGAAQVRIAFAITTNATLVEPEDIELFATHRFAVTVSLDGERDVHDRQRPTHRGRPSFDHTMRGFRLLADRSETIPLFARVTVTPQSLHVRETMDALAEHGLRGVTFAPVLSSPTGQHQLDPIELNLLLDAFITCADQAERRIEAGRPYPFTNLLATWRDIHRATRKTAHCAAGRTYLGVSSSGTLHPCHRYVDAAGSVVGDLERGLDEGALQRWTGARALADQTACQACWARPLCGGGCHVEIEHRGRVACDFIRGWIDHCLTSYVRVSRRAPEQVLRLM